MSPDFLHLPVVSAGAEHLARGYRMSRNMYGVKALDALAGPSAELEIRKTPWANTSRILAPRP